VLVLNNNLNESGRQTRSCPGGGVCEAGVTARYITEWIVTSVILWCLQYSETHYSDIATTRHRTNTYTLSLTKSSGESLVDALQMMLKQRSWVVLSWGHPVNGMYSGNRELQVLTHTLTQYSTSNTVTF
jgi:hypothetical protein